jgi:hypothetical protein
VFASAGCSSESCHGAAPHAAGLDLSSGPGLARTAILKVARETETGTEVARPSVAPARFGTQMPVIHPGSAANSYLVYKLLAKPENYEVDGCETIHEVPVVGGCAAPGSEELARLRQHFVRLDPMPPEDRRVPSLDAIRTLVRFVDAGARLDSCD